MTRIPRSSRSLHAGWSKRGIGEVAELLKEGGVRARGCVTIQGEGPRLEAAAAAKQANEVLGGPDGAWRHPVVQMSNGDDAQVYMGLAWSKANRVRGGALRGALKAVQARFPTLGLRTVQREGIVAVGLLPLLCMRLDKDTRDPKRTWKALMVEELELDAEALAAASAHNRHNGRCPQVTFGGKARGADAPYDAAGPRRAGPGSRRRA